MTASFSVILSGKIMMKCESIANFMVSTICLGLRLRGGVADAKRGRESDTKEESIKKRRRVSSSSSEIENMEVDPQPEVEVARAPTAVVRPLSSAAARSTVPSTPPASELPQASASSTTQKKTRHSQKPTLTRTPPDPRRRPGLRLVYGVVIDHKFPQDLCPQ